MIGLWGKSKWHWEVWLSMWKKMKVDLYLTSIIKMNRLKCEGQMFEILEKKMVRAL